jgi:hypothetical protein
VVSVTERRPRIRGRPRSVVAGCRSRTVLLRKSAVRGRPEPASLSTPQRRRCIRDLAMLAHFTPFVRFGQRDRVSLCTSRPTYVIGFSMTRLLCMRIGTGPSDATLVNLHTVSRVAPYLRRTSGLATSIRTLSGELNGVYRSQNAVGSHGHLGGCRIRQFCISQFLHIS